MASRGKPSLVSIGGLIIISLGLCILLQTTGRMTIDQALALWMITGGLILEGFTLAHGWVAGASLLKPRFRLEQQRPAGAAAGAYYYSIGNPQRRGRRLFGLSGGQVMTGVGLGMLLYTWGLENGVVGALLLVLLGLAVLFNHSCISYADD